jgi:hypothetical protein
VRPNYISYLFDGFYGWHVSMQQGEYFTIVGSNPNFDSVPIFVRDDSSYFKSSDLTDNDSVFDDNFKA